MAKVQKKRKNSRRPLDVPEAELPQKTNYMILAFGIAVIGSPSMSSSLQWTTTVGAIMFSCCFVKSMYKMFFAYSFAISSGTVHPYSFSPFVTCLRALHHSQ